MLTEKYVIVNDKSMIEYSFKGYTFLVNPAKDKKFPAELKKVVCILEKGIDNLTSVDRMQLLNLYNVAYHTSGKIEGIVSLDSSATASEFCKAMRKAAENNPAHICGMCYDYAQEHSFKGRNVRNRHALNLLIMSTVEFTKEELAILPGGILVRINSSGDTENIIYARNMIKYAFSHPYGRVGYWAKNIIPIIRACDELGKPENLVLIQSSPIIGKVVPLAKYFDYVFAVFATKEDVEEALKNGACECNGRKCKACGYSCYSGAWPKKAIIAEYLRGVDNKTRKAIAANSKERK